MKHDTINKSLNIWGTILKVLVLALLSALLIFFCITSYGNYSVSKQNEQENYSRLHNNYSESEIKGAVLLAYQKLENDLEFLDALDDQGIEEDDGVEAYDHFWKGSSNKDASHTYHLVYVTASNPYFFVYEHKDGESEISLIQVLVGPENYVESMEVKNLSDEEIANWIPNHRSELEDYEGLFDSKPVSIKDHSNQPIKDGANLRIDYPNATITIENGEETFSFKPESDWGNDENDNSNEEQD